MAAVAAAAAGRRCRPALRPPKSRRRRGRLSSPGSRPRTCPVSILRVEACTGRRRLRKRARRRRRRSACLRLRGGHCARDQGHNIHFQLSCGFTDFRTDSDRTDRWAGCHVRRHASRVLSATPTVNRTIVPEPGLGGRERDAGEFSGACDLRCGQICMRYMRMHGAFPRGFFFFPCFRSAQQPIPGPTWGAGDHAHTLPLSVGDFCAPQQDAGDSSLIWSVSSLIAGDTSRSWQQSRTHDSAVFRRCMQSYI